MVDARLIRLSRVLILLSSRSRTGRCSSIWSSGGPTRPSSVPRSNCLAPQGLRQTLCVRGSDPTTILPLTCGTAQVGFAVSDDESIARAADGLGFGGPGAHALPSTGSRQHLGVEEGDVVWMASRAYPAEVSANSKRL